MLAPGTLISGSSLLNTLWPSDAISHQTTWWKLVRVMACHLVWCWLLVKCILSSKQWNLNQNTSNFLAENTISALSAIYSRLQCVKSFIVQEPGKKVKMQQEGQIWIELVKGDIRSSKILNGRAAFSLNILTYVLYFWAISNIMKFHVRTALLAIILILYVLNLFLLYEYHVLAMWKTRHQQACHWPYLLWIFHSLSRKGQYFD